MAALEALSRIIGIDQQHLSKEEAIILEAELYTRILNEIWVNFKINAETYLQLIKFNIDMEEAIMESYVIRCLINDILTSESYTLSGIACYTQTPEEIIEDLFIGNKMSTVMGFTRKLIELHKSVRPELYRHILTKITPDPDL